MVQHLNPKGIAKAEAYAPLYRAELERWPVRPEELVVDTRLGRTHALCWGPVGAPPLVALHGAAGSGLDWIFQSQACAKSHRVYALDIPGHSGLSVLAKPLKRIADIMVWLDEVLDALQLPVIDLMGMSLGGGLAASYALHRPSRVGRMIWIAPGSTLLPMRMSFYMHALPCALVPTRGVYERFFRWLGPAPKENRERYEGYVQHIVRGAMTERRIFGMASIPVPAVLSDEQLRAITAPTMVILGEQEVIYDARKALARASAFIPHVETALIPDAGHDLMWSQPERLNAAIAGFLSKSPIQ